MFALGGGVLAIVAMAVARGPYGPPDGASSANDPAAVDGASPTDRGDKTPAASSGAPGTSAGADPLPPPDPPAIAKPLSQEVKEGLATFSSRLRAGDGKAALAALEKVVALDTGIFDDADVRSEVVDLSQLASKMPGDEQERMFSLLSTKSGTGGYDVLYYLVTSKGGSLASKLAADVLKDPENLKRGSQAMQVAYLFYKADCDKKKTLLPRMGRYGDKRALGQLHQVSSSSCRRGGCCIQKDKDLEAAVAALEARGIKP